DLVSPMETLRTAAWIAFLVSLLVRSWRLSDRVNLSFVLAVCLGFLFAAQLLMDMTGWFGAGVYGPLAKLELGYLFIISRLVCAIGALVLVHNVYSNAAPEQRWGVRFICIGLAGFFSYDIHLYTLAALSGGVSWDLYNARGLVDALVVPLIALSVRRNRLWKMEVQISRDVVFHSLSLVAVG